MGHLCLVCCGFGLVSCALALALCLGLGLVPWPLALALALCLVSCVLCLVPWPWPWPCALALRLVPWPLALALALCLVATCVFVPCVLWPCAVALRLILVSCLMVLCAVSFLSQGLVVLWSGVSSFGGRSWVRWGPGAAPFFFRFFCEVCCAVRSGSGEAARKSPSVRTEAAWPGHLFSFFFSPLGRAAPGPRG